MFFFCPCGSLTVMFSLASYDSSGIHITKVCEFCNKLTELSKLISLTSANNVIHIIHINVQINGLKLIDVKGYGWATTNKSFDYTAGMWNRSRSSLESGCSPRVGVSLSKETPTPGPICFI